MALPSVSYKILKLNIPLGSKIFSRKILNSIFRTRINGKKS